MTKVNFEKIDKIKISKTKLKKLVGLILKDEKLEFDEINVIFVNDKQIERINRKFLNHNYPTDVIAFDLSDEFGKVAEIYISFETAKRQAKEYGVSFENEIARLVSHGLLHLAGYNDATRKEKEKMREVENKYIKKAKF